MSKSLVLSLSNKNFLNNKNILIAGEWVLEKHDKDLDNLNYEIFYSKSELKENRIKNFEESAIIYKNILEDLSSQLNSIHSVKLSFKSWIILLGPWLKRFVELCFQKDYLIKEIFKNHEIKKVYGVKNDTYKKHSNDTCAIHPNSRDILWNNNLFSQILDFYNFNVEKNFSYFENEKDLVEEYRQSVSYKRSFIKKIIFFLFDRLNFLRKKNDALIIGTGFPFVYEKLFELSFFQFPQFNKINNNEYSKLNNQLRSKINLNYSREKKDIENFIKSILPKYLPICFVEDFKKIYDTCHKKYPKKPKFILTGLHHDFDENFKFFAAKMVNQGVPYFVLQHGNTYFVEDFVINRPEYDSSDKFFTFGYAKDKKFLAFCNPRTLGKSINYKKKNGKLNILAPPMLGLFFPFERNQEFLRSFELINKFGEKINNNLKEKITLRLHPNFSTSRGLWFKNKYFKNYDDGQIDYGKINYKKFLSQAKANIFFYDSSGILENLHYNLPTVAIWANKANLLYNHINNDFIEEYNLLKEANIIFDDLDKMINHLNKFWDDIDSWWMSKKTQKNIKEFNKNLNIKPKLLSLIKLREQILKYSK